MARETGDVGVILSPNSDIGVIRANWWTWRPTVELLVRRGVVTADDGEWMHVAMGQIEFTDAQAVSMADAVASVLAEFDTERDRLMLDGSISARPPRHDHLPAEWDWYGANREWLESFASFCRRSGGFTPQ